MIASQTYRSLIRRFAILFVAFSVVTDAIVFRYYLTSEGAGRPSFALTVFYWTVGAGIAWVALVLTLRFILPAVMTDAQIQRMGRQRGA